eukprot:SAG31_NODE_17829_length_656_cov_1.244165_2_plen_76_part_00
MAACALASGVNAGTVTQEGWLGLDCDGPPLITKTAAVISNACMVVNGDDDIKSANVSPTVETLSPNSSFSFLSRG